MKMGSMTWVDVENYLKRKSELIIPVGTCEQHGKHLPLNNDILMAEYLSDYLSEQKDVLVAPTINYGINLPCDKYLAGTTSIQTDTMRNILSSLIEWWKFQGFRKFIIITYHGDPFHLETLSDIENTCLLKPWEIEYSDILEKQQTMKHACEAETSVALYLYPEKVKVDKIEEYDIPIEKFMPYLMHNKDDRIENYVGCLGFPSSATREKGKIIVERMKELVVKQYDDDNKDIK